MIQSCNKYINDERYYLQIIIDPFLNVQCRTFAVGSDKLLELRITLLKVLGNEIFNLGLAATFSLETLQNGWIYEKTKISLVNPFDSRPLSYIILLNWSCILKFHDEFLKNIYFSESGARQASHRSS